MAERLAMVQRRARRKEFQIVRGEEDVAHFRFTSFWTNRVEGRYGNVGLNLALEGFFRHKVLVTDSALGQMLASARIDGWFGKQADIELPDGRAYELSSKGILHRVWTLSETNGTGRRQLLTFIEKRGFIKDEGIIDLEESSRGSPDPLLLALLVCYLVVVIHEQEGAVAAAGAT